MTPRERLLALRARNDKTGLAMDAMRPRFEALRTRHEDGTAPRAVSAFQLFQTPPALAARMVELADVQPGHIVLEPSAGLGRLLAPLMARQPGQVVACDVSADCLAEIFRQFPEVSIRQGDFLARHHGTFDRVLMNPPFHMRSDIAHVRHALEHLHPGGVLVGLCMATHHRKEALEPLADYWEEIPAGAFRAEGTNVPTYLFRIRMHH